MILILIEAQKIKKKDFPGLFFCRDLVKMVKMIVWSLFLRGEKKTCEWLKNGFRI